MQPHDTTRLIRCTKCQTELPLDRFNRCKRDGYSQPCKACRKAWRAAHKEYIRANNRAYKQAKKEVIYPQKRAYFNANRERWLRYHLAYYQEHKEEWRAYWIANRNRINATRQVRVRAHGDPYRLRLAQAPGHHTKADVKRQYAAQKGRCYYCHQKVGKRYHVDHVVPVSRGGHDDPSNLVIACQTCNTRKRNKMPHEWPEGNRLL